MLTLSQLILSLEFNNIYSMQDKERGLMELFLCNSLKQKGIVLKTQVWSCSQEKKETTSDKNNEIVMDRLQILLHIKQIQADK